MAPGKWKEVLSDLEPFKPEKSLKVEREEGLGETLAAMFKIYESTQLYYNLAMAEPRSKRRLRKSIGDSCGTHENYLENCINEIKSSGRNITKRVVEEFVQQVIKYEDGFAKEDYYEERTGLFTSALVQASFGQGHNNFELLLIGNRCMDFIGYKLEGEPARRLSISIIAANQPSDRGRRSAVWLTNMHYVNATILGLKVVPAFICGNSKSCMFTSDNPNILDAVRRYGQYVISMGHSVIVSQPADTGMQVLMEA